MVRRQRLWLRPSASYVPWVELRDMWRSTRTDGSTAITLWFWSAVRFFLFCLLNSFPNVSLFYTSPCAINTFWLDVCAMSVFSLLFAFIWLTSLSLWIYLAIDPAERKGSISLLSGLMGKGSLWNTYAVECYLSWKDHFLPLPERNLCVYTYTDGKCQLYWVKVTGST